MIPKIIHYCWFGRNPKPKEVLDYIETWKKHNPDYEIKEWNEDNFDIHCCKYVWEAYNVKKFAFVSDYARLYALYTEGGIYLDTDVEVRKSFDVHLGHKTMLGWEADYIGTGMLSCAKGQNWTKQMMDSYHRESFIRWSGKLATIPNPYRLCKILNMYGLKMNREEQLLEEDIKILPLEFFCAHLADHTKYYITDNTVCIHHYSSTWSHKRQTILQKLQFRVNNILIKMKTMRH
ncbi:MAG: glycosyl transferase [Prevotellaceae bacterium]|nr:glycosyl transferase [Prevotellaceae bacterium]